VLGAGIATVDCDLTVVAVGVANSLAVVRVAERERFSGIAAKCSRGRAEEVGAGLLAHTASLCADAARLHIQSLPVPLALVTAGPAGRRSSVARERPASWRATAGPRWTTSVAYGDSADARP
jgi:histone H3/H4